MMNDNKFYIDKCISNAQTMHADYYNDENIFKNSVKNVFTASWKLVGHKTNFSNNIIPFTFLSNLLPYELLLTNNNNVYSCISNVCTHRGHILCNKNDDSKLLKCRYHGRTFDLCGKLKSAPGFEEVKNFPSKGDNLKSINMKNWNDFLFVSLGKGIDISGALSDIESRLNNFPFSKLKHSSSLSSTYEIDAHWALYCDNYLEGFHVPFVHKGLSSEIKLSSYKTEILDNAVLQYADDIDGDGIYGYYYWIFPNLMLNFYKWGLSVNIVEPITKDKTLVRFLTYPIDKSKDIKKSVSELVSVELEDQQVVQNVHKGIKSGLYQRGRYSVKHEKGVHYFHSILSKYI